MKIYKSIFVFFIAFPFLYGCTKNETHYYPDKSIPGLSIFSNTGNNVFSCLINGQPWRTFDRKSGGFLSRGTYEVMIAKREFDSVTNFLSIEWSGYYANNKNNFGQISLFLSVPKNFSFADFSALQGKRLIIDGINNYFLAEVDVNNARGSGYIYFNKAEIDSSASYYYQGKLSGLLEADFGTFKLTSGRFDHDLENGQILFY